MANTTTIKQRVLDILFEDEPDYPQTKQEKTEVKRKEAIIIEQPRKREVSPIKATDLLYGKKDKHNSAFINLNEEIKSVSSYEKQINKSEYSPTPNISPIFGTIEVNKKKSDDVTSVDYASVEKQETNYLDTVISPIYGYDTKRANEVRTNLEAPNEIKEAESVDITEDLFATLETKLTENNSNRNNIEDTMTKTSEMDLFADFYWDKEE